MDGSVVPQSTYQIEVYEPPRPRVMSVDEMAHVALSAGVHRLKRADMSRQTRVLLGLTRISKPLMTRLEQASVTHSNRCADRRLLSPAPRSIGERLPRTLLRRYVAEVERRGGETEIVGAYGVEHLAIVERQHGLTLLGCSGWRQYSRRFGARRASLAYLCGLDDNGPWAVRVPGTCRSVSDAVEWVTPAEVHRAQADGLRVLRQGDVYAVEMRRGDRTSTDPLPASHVWDLETRMLRHAPADGAEHEPLHVPYGARWIRQRVYAHGRLASASPRRAYGD